MSSLAISQPKFFTTKELFVQAWRTWKQILPKYLYFLTPFFLLEIGILFLTDKYLTGGLSSTPLLNLISFVQTGFLGVFNAIVACLIFRDRNKTLSFTTLYQEAGKLFWGYWLEYWCFLLLIMGGFGLFIIPGIIFAVWFGYFGWLKVYNRDVKRFHFGESWALVEGYAGKIFILVCLYLFVFTVISVWLRTPAGFTNGNWLDIGKNLLSYSLSTVVGSFFFAIDGVIFERLLKMKSPLQSKKMTKPVIVSVVGWLIGWLLMFAIMAVTLVLLLPPQN